MADLNLRLEVRVTPRMFQCGLIGLLLSVMATELSSESVTLSTYYPAPSGVYTQMLTTGNTWLARDSGNVGIGTANPSYPLTVERLDNTANPIAAFYPQNLTQSVNIAYNHLYEGGTNGNNSLFIDAQTTGNLLLQTSGGTGNVGVGASAPAAMLDVKGNPSQLSTVIGDAGCGNGYGGIGFGSMAGCSNYALLGDGTNIFLNRPTNGTMHFREGNTEEMTIAHGGAGPSGFVGINNGAPAADLDVSGGNSGGSIVLRQTGCSSVQWSEGVSGSLCTNGYVTMVSGVYASMWELGPPPPGETGPPAVPAGSGYALCCHWDAAAL